MKKTYIKSLILVMLFSANLSLALEFDLSVDEEIRKNYNPSKLELEGLPPLPNAKPATPSKPVTSIPNSSQIPSSGLKPANSKPVVSKVDKSSALKLRKGTKFTVKSCQTISDSTHVGTRISFVTKTALYQKGVTVPQGTVFKGEVTNSHTAQITGNGGLIVLSVDSMILNGSTIGLKAKITKANHKKIFINNIKGKRLYWKNVAKQVSKGQNFYNKTRRASAKLSNNPIGAIISPLPTIFGVGVYAVNLTGSPVFALFSSGGRISIPSGSEFEIKLLDDVYFY